MFLRSCHLCPVQKLQSCRGAARMAAKAIECSAMTSARPLLLGFRAALRGALQLRPGAPRMLAARGAANAAEQRRVASQSIWPRSFVPRGFGGAPPVALGAVPGHRRQPALLRARPRCMRTRGDASQLK